MFAQRFLSRIAIAILPLTLVSCENYAFLSDESSGSNSGPGSSSGGTSGGSGSGGGTTNSNTNGSADNSNDNAASDLPTSPTGDVAQELCDGFIVITERDGRALNVYAATAGGNFADWSPGDDIGFNSESGALVNFSDDTNLTARVIGVYGGNTLFLSRNEVAQTVTLQNGSVWVYGPDDAEEVRQWHISADLITQVDVDATHAVIVNRTRCTSIAGSSQ